MVRRRNSSIRAGRRSRTHLPVGSDRTEVDDPDVPDRGQRLAILLGKDRFVNDRAHGLVLLVR
jgi:hypothetical protein